MKSAVIFDIQQTTLLSTYSASFSLSLLAESVLGVVIIAVVAVGITFARSKSLEQASHLFPDSHPEVADSYPQQPTVDPEAPAPENPWLIFNSNNHIQRQDHFAAYRIKYLPGWEVKVEQKAYTQAERDEYGPHGSQDYYTVTLRKGNYFVKILQEIQDPVRICATPDVPADLVLGYDKSELMKNYKELKFNGGRLRYNLTSGFNGDSNKFPGLREFTLCVKADKPKSDESYYNYKYFMPHDSLLGRLSYIMPKKYDKNIVAEMDEIVKTLELR